MKAEKMKILLLHESPELTEKCAELLNTQWKRSTSARVQSLEKSYKDLPDSLLLIEEKDSVKEVVGHSRLTRVLEDPNGCWIGSVVIAVEKRKKGYGKYLMQKTEEYAKQLKFSTAYLNTHDQQGFYEHLGYIYGNAMSSVSFKWNGFLKNDLLLMKDQENQHTQNEELENKNGEILQRKPQTSSIPPPPPLPSLNNNFKCQNAVNKNLGQYWMQKNL